VTWEQPWSQPGGDFTAEAIAQEYHALESGNQFELQFDTAGVDLVAGWLSGGPNNGLLLRAADLGADNLKYFYSEDTPYNPILNFTFATSDTTDTTVTAIASHDAFIAQPGEPPEDAVLRVGDGIVYRTWLLFDLSAVPESVFVNRATLALTMMDFSSPLDRMLQLIWIGQPLLRQAAGGGGLDRPGAKLDLWNRKRGVDPQPLSGIR